MPWIIASILAAVAAGPAPKDASFLVWSDLHGDPSPRLFAWVDSLRRQSDQWKRPLLALDAGDAFFGSDLSYISAGSSEARVLNLVKPDAIVLGAQDFYWTRSRLDTLVGSLKLPVLTSNLRNAIDDKPYGRKDWGLWDFDGLLVGVVGVVDPDISSADRPARTIDLRSEDPEERVRSAQEDLRRHGASVVVVLSHAGAEADENLARQIPELDLVVGSRDGGTDSLYRIGRTWIARVAEGSSHVQKIDVDFSDDALSVEAKSLPVPAGIRIPAAWEPVFDSLERLRRSKADSVVGELREAWPRTRREGSLGNFLADALREEAGADVGLWPAGAIKAGLPKGRVTQGDLWKATGMFAQVSVFELPGSELKRLIKNQLTRAKDFLFLSGASCTADSTASGGPESQVSVGGKPIQGGDHYRIAIPQGLRENIYDLTGFSLSSASPEYLERWDRDLVLEHVRKVGFKTSLGRVPATYGSLR